MKRARFGSDICSDCKVGNCTRKNLLIMMCNELGISIKLIDCNMKPNANYLWEESD